MAGGREGEGEREDGRARATPLPDTAGDAAARDGEHILCEREGEGESEGEGEIEAGRWRGSDATLEAGLV